MSINELHSSPKAKKPTGGQVGHTVSPEAREKVSAALLGRHTSERTEFKKGLVPHNAGTAVVVTFVCKGCLTTVERVKHSSGDGIFCSVKCSANKRTGANHWKWNASGRSIVGPGYVRLRAPEGYRSKYQYEHVLKAEAALGRPLKKGEQVHHVNADKQDNDNRNLVICDGAYHRMLERRMSDLFQRENFPSFRAA